MVYYFIPFTINARTVFHDCNYLSHSVTSREGFPLLHEIFIRCAVIDVIWPSLINYINFHIFMSIESDVVLCSGRLIFVLISMSSLQWDPKLHFIITTLYYYTL